MRAIGRLNGTPHEGGGVRAFLYRPGLLLSNRASALIGVMAIITAVLLVGVAIFILGHAESDVVEYTVDDARAFFLAEGGLERMRGYLAVMELDQPNYDPVGDSSSGGLPGGGSYYVLVTKDTSGGSWLDAYEIVSTGTQDGVQRQVKATVVEETFAMYQWFIGSTGGGFSWFRTGEYFEGPVHVNGDLQIDGDPYFDGHVSAGGGYTDKIGSNPYFAEGYQTHVPKIELPSQDYVFETVRDEASVVVPDLGPNNAYFEVELGAPADGWLTYTGYDKTGGLLQDAVEVEIAGTNGVIWFNDHIKLWGTLDGELTLGVYGNVIITDDIVYEGSTPGHGPDADCDDVLGVIASGLPDGNIIIERNVANEDNCEVHGVLMALQNTIMAEEYQDGPVRGNFTMYGGLIAEKAIHLAQYTDGVVTSGYIRDYHFDPRVADLPPPFFPFASEFSIIIWSEMVPPRPEYMVGG
jgi:hypothetical protein